MLEDFRLRVFVTVASLKSFSKAASELKISQPAVSQHISELERQLNVKLFRRQYGVMVLTPAGEVFFRHAQVILDDYRKAEMMFQDYPARVIKVAASEDVYDHIMSEVFSDFTKVHQEIAFMHSFPDDADVSVSVRPDPKNKGTLVLSWHPSDKFASTDLWKMLSALTDSI